MKKKSSQSGAKVLVIGIVLIGMVLGYYYYLSNKRPVKDDTEIVTTTAVQEALMRDLEHNYPPTPREVVKYYGQLTQCFYNEEYTDEEFEQLAFKIQGLYDDELVANKTRQQYLDDLKWDINNMKQQELVVSSYSPSSSTDVEEFTRDGFKWARLRCVFTLRQGTSIAASEEIFLLRKDETGHWKIYGWKLAEDEEE